ncbi:MAG: hypothetical protein IJS45_11480 [Clostridia bacterium]|nr:hypothetical protein [Clostridia bacterium]
MKTYELMAGLGEIPAADEVIVSTCVSLEEIIKCGDEIDPGVYSLSFRVDSVDAECAIISAAITK